MSLILEALRKSEAERRRGQAPDLHAELPPAHATRTAALPAWAWLLLACALLLAAAWFARGLLPERTLPAPSAHVAGTTTVAPTPPVEYATTQPRFRPPQAMTATPAPAPTTQPAKPSQPGVASANVAPTSATTAAVVAPAPVPPNPAPSAASSSPAVRADATLQLSDLSAEERKSLPPLKLSMHLWNPDPAKRFVILDGNRVGEGDRVGDAVVAAITPDGVELDWNGRRLQVPIR
jgi:general secretion pathway protein B